jgi:hypothetical protein
MVIIAAELEGISTRKDKTLKLTFGTQELAPNKGGELMAMQNAICFLAIKQESFSSNELAELDKLKAAEYGGKTKSQTLRNVLFLNWRDKDQEGFKTSEQHYEYYMQKFIDHMKNKLD